MTIHKNPLVKPFVKWAGGKRQLLPEIKRYLPSKIKDYYEPFVGGGAVFLNMQCPHPVINDFNDELINTYLVVRDDVDSLIHLLKKHELNNSSDYYYQMRAWDRTGELQKRSNTERAARFIYLNKTGFNGLFRVNSQGQINVPYGHYKNPTIFNEKVLHAVSLYLNRSSASIFNGDYYDAIKSAKKGDFVYLDPPYAPISEDKQSFVDYTLNGCGREEQERLRDVFNELTKRGVNAMLSNSKVQLIEDLYKEYQETTRTVTATRNINSNSAGRGRVDEVLIMNYKTGN